MADSAGLSLLSIVKLGELDAVKDAVDDAGAGTDVNEKESETWDAPLHKAVAGGHLEIVKVLLAAKADPNQENVRGRGLHSFPFPLNLSLLRSPYDRN